MEKKAPLVILEGNWWGVHEPPQVLPYFNALEYTFKNLDLCHRTIRSAGDIGYYVSRIQEGAGAMLYFACHGGNQSLAPTDDTTIVQDELLHELIKCKNGAISFVHFGCCEMVDAKDRRKCHQGVMDVTGAKWVSGYTNEVPWLRSTLLDLSLVAEVFAPTFGHADGRAAPLKKKADYFMEVYEQVARELGFSALSRVSAGNLLFPERLHR